MVKVTYKGAIGRKIAEAIEGESPTDLSDLRGTIVVTITGEKAVNTEPKPPKKLKPPKPPKPGPAKKSAPKTKKGT